MFVCEACNRIVPQSAECPVCGGKRLFEAESNTPVYLLTQHSTWSGVIEDALREAGIPLIKKGVLGAGLSFRLGEAFESYSYYVPYGAYEVARKLMASFFEPEQVQDDPNT